MLSTRSSRSGRPAARRTRFGALTTLFQGRFRLSNTSHTALARLLAVVLALCTFGVASHFQAQPAYAYNCVNVLLRDSYWSHYRGIIESGSNAAGIGGAFARNGWAVDGTPAEGAIVVWPAGYFGASGTGHVGIVSAVYDNGTILVRHENWPYGTAEHAQVFPARGGFQYVHPAKAIAIVNTEVHPDPQPEQGDVAAQVPAEAAAGEANTPTDDQ